MGKHAFLSASSSHRWLECPPSAKLCSEQEDRASPYAQQGTDCHELCAYLVEKSLGRDVEDPTENLTYYDQEMQDCAESYRDYVTEQIEAAKQHCPDPQISIVFSSGCPFPFAPCSATTFPYTSAIGI